MVVPSPPASTASSHGSDTIDSPRKRNEFPRDVTGRRTKVKTPSVSTGSNASSSRVQGSQGSSVRPPQSPHSKLSPRGMKNTQRRNTRSPSPKRSDHLERPTQLRRSNSSPSPVPGETPKNFWSGRPPVSPGGLRRVSSNSSLVGQTANSTRSALSRSSTRSVASRSTAGSSRASVEQRQDTPVRRTPFCVRVSMGYLTGIKAETLLKKKKKNTPNMLVVGYAALAKSGKRIALSQPLGPSIDDGTQKSLKLFWTNPKGPSDACANKNSKRRLHFSLKLERESDEEDSTAADIVHTPEVVKIVIGLKCGEEKVPLGVANLVVSGKETMDQEVDMAVRPISDTSFADLKRNQKSRLGIFGGAKKSQGNTFSGHNQLYRLASNATLRVSVDVKQGNVGGNKTSVWGDGDDASQITSFSFDTRGTRGSFQRRMIGNQLIVESFSNSTGTPARKQIPQVAQRKGATSREGNGPIIISSQGTGAQGAAEHSLPLKYVVVRAAHTGGGRSLASDLTSPSAGLCASLCYPISMCMGEPAAATGLKSHGMTSFSFEEEEGSWDDDNRDEEAFVAHRFQATGSGDDRFSRDDIQYSPSREQNQVTKSRRGARELLQAQESNIGRSSDAASAAAETVDITVATYEDLKDAQATLLRYATKVGVNMEDLLAGMEKNKKRSKSRR